MVEGQYIVLLTTPGDFDRVALEARRDDLEVRDCLCIHTPQSTIMGLLVRSPLRDTVVSSVVRRGIGALAIDASRISTTESTSRPAGKAPVTNMTTSTLHGRNYVSEDHEGGRYPSNLLLVHGADCEHVGTKKLNPKEGHRPNPVQKQADGRIQFNTKDVGYQKISYTSEDGTEKVDDWNCQPDCPVRLLDLQSGELGKWYPRKTDKQVQSVVGFGRGQEPEFYDDSGGASRFFYQATSLDEIKAYLQHVTGTNVAD